MSEFSMYLVFSHRLIQWKGHNTLEIIVKELISCLIVLNGIAKLTKIAMN